MIPTIDGRLLKFLALIITIDGVNCDSFTTANIGQVMLESQSFMLISSL